MQLLFVNEQFQQVLLWKRRIESIIARLRKGFIRLGDRFKEKWEKKMKEELRKKHRIKVKDFTVVNEELKQNISAKSQLRRYHD